MKARVYTNRASLAIISHGLFETVSIIVIVTNSLFLALDDPLDPTPAPYSEVSD